MALTPYYESNDVTLYHGRWQDVVPDLRGVDAFITDPPYGTTQNKWDVPPDFSHLWQSMLMAAKQSAAFVFTASQPFTSALVMSKPELFRHEWIWLKNRGSNFANTVREPFKEHESVLVFSRGKWTYNKQMQARTGGGADRVKYAVKSETDSDNYRKMDARMLSCGDLRVPSSWQKFNTETGLHPTQKPVPLFAYLVRTYTNPGELIVDNYAGSGTTLVAARMEGRRAIGVEQEERYCEAISRRLEQATLPLAEAV